MNEKKWQEALFAILRALDVTDDTVDIDSAVLKVNHDRSGWDEVSISFWMRQQEDYDS